MNKTEIVERRRRLDTNFIPARYSPQLRGASGRAQGLAKQLGIKIGFDIDVRTSFRDICITETLYVTFRDDADAMAFKLAWEGQAQ